MTGQLEEVFSVLTTLFEHQKKSLLAEDVVGLAVDVELHQAVALCTWCRTTEHGSFRSTAMVLVEQELLHWLARPDDAELKQVIVLMPADDGWQPKKLTCLWYLANTPEGSPAVVCRDVDGASFTLWPFETVPDLRNY